MLKKILFTVHNSLDCLARQSRKSAFTLAETLIVMGIIGVVAALTLPNLNSSTGEKEKVVKLQKIYSNLQDALGRAEAVYGPCDEWCGVPDENCEKRHFERITEFMKYSKRCTINNCSSFKFNENFNGSDGEPMRYGVILPDGAAINIGIGDIRIDIDGFNKGKNTNCYDYFIVSYNTTQGIYTSEDSGDDAVMTTSSGDIFSGSSSAAYKCAHWIIENGNMDYLKKCSNLKFGVKTSCK